MQTILVTGGAGFIGSNYLNTVVPANPDITFVNVDALTYAANLANLNDADAPNYYFEEVNITETSALAEVFKKYTPTGIINFAAESHVDKSISNPKNFIDTNVVGTMNLLQLSLEYNIERFYQISTDEVYGALGLTDPAFTEESNLAPNNPYSASKAAADLLVRSYHKTFGLATVVSRCSNNYGPNQDDTKFIPLCIARLLKGEKVPLYGDGSNIRDWLHVSDHVAAIDLVFKEGKAGEVYNIGGGTELSNKELLEKLLTLTGRDESSIEQVTDRKGHDFRYAINSSKLEKELGWKAVVEFQDGMKELVN
jgi:dTDP-glucose 4,6-dehydratase